MEVSVIIRTKNEVAWIERVLKALMYQDYNDREIIVVDSGSTDGTQDIVRKYKEVRLLDYKGRYFPGKAINLGISNSSGRYIALLSAHCIPLNDKWIERLLVDFLEGDDIAAVYGRQEPLPDSSLFDKRDLWTVFGIEKRIQREDYFFHNANSMIRRDIWEEVKFDESLESLEDQKWAQDVTAKGYAIVYEPHASVYHYHGIHHGYNLERAKRVVNAIEKIKNG